MLLLALLALPTPPSVQEPPSGLDAWRLELERRTAPARERARAAWEAEWPKAAAGDRAALDALAAAGAPVQEFALAALDRAAGEGGALDGARRALAILARVANPVGASALMDRVADLPPSLQGAALTIAVERGGRDVWERARRLAEADPGALGQTATVALLTHGPAAWAPGLMARLDAEAADGPALAAALRNLAGRETSEGLRLPEAVFRDRRPEVLAAAFDFLAAHPEKDRGEWLVEHVVDPRRPADLRVAALRAFEAGVPRFRWRDGRRSLLEAIEEGPRDAVAEEIAWALHRLGERNAERWLLAPYHEAVEARPNSVTPKLRLARRLMEVGEDGESYRLYKKVFSALEGQGMLRVVQPQDWLWAARAAVAGRHFKEAEAWLEASELTPEQLAEAAAWPEFAEVADRSAFRRFFPQRR